jgi:F-type H+-transporting ATPase subunit alpha
MQKIKPAEVSALLKKQLETANIQSSFDEVGTVLEVGDGIARVYVLQTLNTVSLYLLIVASREWY